MLMSPTLDLAAALGWLDWAVLVGLLTASHLVAWWGHRRHQALAVEERDPESRAALLEYLIMGRSLTLPMFVVTLVSSWYGGILGVTEQSFTRGLFNFLTQGVFWYATYLVFAFVLVPRIRAVDAITLPEVVGRLFGPRSAQVAAVFNFFNVLPVAYAISIGLMVQLLVGGPLWLSMVGGTALVCVYAMFGGLRAVVLTDLVQFVLMCGAVALVLGLSFTTFGGWGYLTTHLPATHFSPTGDQGWARTLVWGLIALATLVDPTFYQRCFAANSPRTARNGILWATLIWCLFDLCTTFGGMYAAAAIPTADSRQAYLVYALQLLPAGLRGFFLAGVVATILSTLDSYIFVASNTLSYDLAPGHLRNRVWVRRASIGLVGLLAVALGQLFDGSIREVWLVLGSYSAGCLLIPMVIGYTRPGLVGDRLFVGAVLPGAAAITAWRLTPHTGWAADVDGLYIGCLVTGAILLGGILARRRSP